MANTKTYIFLKTMIDKRYQNLSSNVRHTQALKIFTYYVVRSKRTMASSLPYFTKGEVVKGFGRGSKKLGCPTANFPRDVVQKLPNDIQTGIYYGWAQVDDSPIYKMVMSIGWNPFFKNEEKSMETHIIHKFADDFYGRILKMCILGYLRPEKNFSSLEELKEAIASDIQTAVSLLDASENLEVKNADFFKN